MIKRYKLLAADGTSFESEVPGTLGGYRPKKIYDRLNCYSALRALEAGRYAKHRVFFQDQATASAAGYRPCGKCMKADYLNWKQNLAARLALPAES